MKVKEIMTTEVVFLAPNTTVYEAAKKMEQYNVGAMPVCDSTGLIGIVTDRDIVLRNIAIGKDPVVTTVRDIMTMDVIFAEPNMDIDDVSDLMAEEKIRRVPVLENNKLVGILALSDLAVDQRFDFEASEALSEISKPDSFMQNTPKMRNNALCNSKNVGKEDGKRLH